MQYNDESVRLRTFNADNWPHGAFLDPNILAQTGLYFIGPGDTLKCHFCKVEIRCWRQDDDEIEEHLRFSPSCPLLIREATDNIPIDEELLNEALPILPPRFPPAFVDIAPELFGFLLRPPVVVDNAAAATTTSVPIEFEYKIPEYAMEAKRLGTYEFWPAKTFPRPEALSEAGFFYKQIGDRVQCFSCAGILRDWDSTDVPWEQHALWFRDCKYLQLVKGNEYVKDLERKRSEAKASSGNGDAAAAAPSPPSPQSAEDIDKKDKDLCKICYIRDSNIAFLPCGHVVTCGVCASTMVNCPVCRLNSSGKLRLFFS